jgi:hypothetical protein
VIVDWEKYGGMEIKLLEKGFSKKEKGGRRAGRRGSAEERRGKRRPRDKVTRKMAKVVGL